MTTIFNLFENLMVFAGIAITFGLVLLLILWGITILDYLLRALTARRKGF